MNPDTQSSNVIPFPQGGISPAEKISFDGDLSSLSPEDQEMFDPQEEETTAPQQEFDSNLAEHLSDEELTQLQDELTCSVEEDIKARSEWEKIYKDNYKYLGLKEIKKDRPWPGACGVVHPALLEAIVRYQSRAAVKLFPSSGPAKLKIPFGVNFDIQESLKKTEAKFNSYLIEQMPELMNGTKKALFAQAQIGCAFKKIYPHNELKRITSQFVPAEDLIIPYGYDDLQLCPRYTHQVRRSLYEIENLQREGYYIKNDLESCSIEKLSEIEEEKAQTVGVLPGFTNKDAIRLREVYVNHHFDNDQYGDERKSPYVVTITEDTGKILRISRNWDEHDPKRLREVCFVSYVYVPADGPYGYGLIQLVGQLISGATKILQELIDAGELSNLPVLLASNAARMESQKAFVPGEVRKVMIDPEQLSKSFFPVPFKEPSQVLMALAQGLIEEAKAFSSTADLDISASSQNAPVGTTLALLERQTEVGNAVQLQLHESFRQELKCIIDGLKKYQPDEYNDIFGELDQALQKSGQNLQVMPVGDPNSATMSQRLLQYQSLSQMAMQCPQVFDLAALARIQASAMGIDDVDLVIPDKSKIPSQDPVTENMSILTGKPVQAYDYQDHRSHIQVHMAILQDQMMQQVLATDPQAQAKMNAAMAHIAEHVAFNYHQEIQKALGVQLPPPGQMPPQAENSLSQLMASASQKVLALHNKEAAQLKAQQDANDPVNILENRELDIKQQSIENDKQIELAKLSHKVQSDDVKHQIELYRIDKNSQSQHESHLSKVAAEADSGDLERNRLAIETAKTLLQHHQANQAHDLAEKQANKPDANTQS